MALSEDNLGYFIRTTEVKEMLHCRRTLMSHELCPTRSQLHCREILTVHTHYCIYGESTPCLFSTPQKKKLIISMTTSPVYPLPHPPPTCSTPRVQQRSPEQLGVPFGPVRGRAVGRQLRAAGRGQERCIDLIPYHIHLVHPPPSSHHSAIWPSPHHSH